MKNGKTCSLYSHACFKTGPCCIFSLHNQQICEHGQHTLPINHFRPTVQVFFFFIAVHMHYFVHWLCNALVYVYIWMNVPGVGINSQDSPMVPQNTEMILLNCQKKTCKLRPCKMECPPKKTICLLKSACSWPCIKTTTSKDAIYRSLACAAANAYYPTQLV